MRKPKLLLIIYLLTLSTALIAEGSEDSLMSAEEFQIGQKELDHHLTAEMSALYTANVAPIFEKKCVACHGHANSLPWYHAIPGIRQMIDNDITEAREHLNLENGFPFGGHGSVKEDLDSIKKVIVDSTMPPARYKIIHWDSELNRSERQIVLQWLSHCLDAF